MKISLKKSTSSKIRGIRVRVSTVFLFSLLLISLPALTLAAPKKGHAQDKNSDSATPEILKNLPFLSAQQEEPEQKTAKTSPSDTAANNPRSPSPAPQDQETSQPAPATANTAQAEHSLPAQTQDNQPSQDNHLSAEELQQASQTPTEDTASIPPSSTIQPEAKNDTTQQPKKSTQAKQAQNKASSQQNKAKQVAFNFTLPKSVAPIVEQAIPSVTVPLINSMTSQSASPYVYDAFSSRTTKALNMAAVLMALLGIVLINKDLFGNHNKNLVLDRRNFSLINQANLKNLN